jgi:hypothetical protein
MCTRYSALAGFSGNKKFPLAVAPEAFACGFLKAIKPKGLVVFELPLGHRSCLEACNNQFSTPRSVNKMAVEPIRPVVLTEYRVGGSRYA